MEKEGHDDIIGLTVTLYLIGTGLSMKALRHVGVGTLLQGILLWIIVAVGSLTLIRSGWIQLWAPGTAAASAQNCEYPVQRAW